MGARACAKNPTSATYLGDHRFDDRWPDLSPGGPAGVERGRPAVVKTLDRIDPAQLSAADQLNRDLFRRLYEGNTGVI